MSEYKSPIKVTFEDISNEVIDRYDDAIICIAKKITGIDVDKERLTNALLLDRKLVRCKDCKYWAELTFLVPPKHHCGRLLQQYKGISERVSFETDADDFCSRGERKWEE